MRTPQRRTPIETTAEPRPGRPRGSYLKRHWLTGAFLIGVMALVSFTGLGVYQADQQLRQALETQARVDAELKALQEKNRRLRETLQRVTSDESMELKAKQLGFTHENEQVYQTGVTP